MESNFKPPTPIQSPLTTHQTQEAVHFPTVRWIEAVGLILAVFSATSSAPVPTEASQISIAHTAFFLVGFGTSWVAHSRAGQVLVSNWQLSGIVIAMSGLPVDVFDPAAGTLYGLTGARPNWAPGASRKTATSNVPPGYYFNPFAFALPVVQPNQSIPSAKDPTALAPEGGSDIGNLGRNVLRGPSQSNIDLSIAKEFPLSEAKNLEVRADFFNVLNHASRSNPISDISAAEAFDPSGRILSPGDFGRGLSFDSGPRIVQLSLSFNF